MVVAATHEELHFWGGGYRGYHSYQLLELFWHRIIVGMILVSFRSRIPVARITVICYKRM